MITPEKHDCIVQQTVFLQLVKNHAGLSVHNCDIVVLLCNIASHDGCVWIIGWYDNRVRIGCERFRRRRCSKSRQPHGLKGCSRVRPDTTFMRCRKIEHRKERLIGVPAATPMCLRAGFIPGCGWSFKLVVLLHIIGRVVAGCTQIFRKGFNIMRRDHTVWSGLGCKRSSREGPHMMCSKTDLMHAGDNGCTAGGADPRSGEYTCVARTTTGE